MPLLARWFIKTALAYLVAALLVGVLLAVVPSLAFSVPVLELWYVYLHLFMVGWLTQLIFGVAFWFFPRHSRERPYGATWPVTASFALINAGLLMRAVAEPGAAASENPVWEWLLGISALLQWLAVVCFVGHIWSRVKTK